VTPRLSRRQGMYLALAAALFMAAAPASARINSLLEAQRLLPTSVFESMDPAQFFLTTALGGLRGLAVDFLWVRSMKMAEEHKFFEAAATCEIISKLQPHFLQIWAFNAWNMAYNVSAEAGSPEQKWTWVKRGIELLEKGIAKNSNSSLLYQELAFVYYHKCAPPLKSSDEASNYYRKKILEETGKSADDLAVEYLELAAKQPDSSPERLELLIPNIYLSNGRFVEARDRFAALREKYPKDKAIEESFRTFFPEIVAFYIGKEPGDVTQEDLKAADRWWKEHLRYFPDDKRSLLDMIRDTMARLAKTRDADLRYKRAEEILMSRRSGI